MAQDTKIYLKLDKRPKNVAEVLNNFWGIYGAVETFHDKECIKQQCKAGKSRSFDDLYYCCKTYFPNVTVKKVFHEVLISTREDNKILIFSHCNTISKITLFFYNYTGIIKAWGDLYVYQKEKTKQLDSIWSWGELFEMVNIKSNQDLTNYREKYNVKLK